MNKEILKNLSYGVYVVTVSDGKKSTGCVANSIMQVTYDTIAVSLNHNNYTTDFVKNNKFGVSILSTEVNDNIIPVFGFSCGREVDKFKDIKKINVEGVDVLADSIGYLICKTVDVVETETHSVFIAKILEGDIIKNQTPMTYA